MGARSSLEEGGQQAGPGGSLEGAALESVKKVLGFRCALLGLQDP